jgi:hypothetical protein
MADLRREFWMHETGTGQQVAQLHNRYVVLVVVVVVVVVMMMMMMMMMMCTVSLKSSCCYVQNIEFLQQYLMQSLRNVMCLLPSLVDIVWSLAVFMITFFKISLTVSPFPHFFFFLLSPKLLFESNCHISVIISTLISVMEGGG